MDASKPNHEEQDLPVPAHRDAAPDAGTRALAEFLDRVCAVLDADVPGPRVRELRRELAAHLEALVEAHEELGCTREEAEEAALRQFGSPRLLARRWLREWRRGPRRPPSLAALAAAGTLLLWTAGFFSWLLPELLGTMGYPLLAAVLCGPLLPLVLGYRAGSVSAERASRGVSGPALARIGALGLALALALPDTGYFAGHPSGRFMAALMLLFPWLLVSASAAGLAVCARLWRSRREEAAG